MISLVLLSLITYRLTLLISKEKGPFEILKRFRKLIGIYEKETQYTDEYGTTMTVVDKVITNEFGVLIDCTYCLSFWVSLGLSLIFLPLSFDLILNWLAIWGLVCLTFQVIK